MLIRRLFVVLGQRNARTEQVAVAVRVVGAADRRPVLARNQGCQRIRRRFPRISVDQEFLFVSGTTGSEQSRQAGSLSYIAFGASSDAPVILSLRDLHTYGEIGGVH